MYWYCRLSLCLLLTAGCSRVDHLGKPPSFTPNTETPEQVAMLWPGLPLTASVQRTVDGASLWSRERQSLLGDRRAVAKGDILTVVIEIDLSSGAQSSGQGSVSRNEKLTLRVAATITDVLPNGVLKIAGSQELRVNFEIRELLVSGYVRPEDITRQNVVTYDKIASARVSYGGRGQITDVQQPRYGQQILDAILPF